MHIITTAYKYAWPEKLDDCIFLGDWCFKNEQDKNNLKITQIVNYHFNDRKIYLKTEKIIDSVYSELFKQFNTAIGKVFGVEVDARYCQIVWGLWLYRFVSIFYDRYLSIKNVLLDYPDAETNLISKDSFVVSDSSKDFFNYCRDDYFNLQIFSSIWEHLGGNINKKINVDISPSEIDSYSVQKALSIPSSNFIKKSFISLLEKRADKYLFYTGFSKKMQLSIMINSKFRVFPFELAINNFNKDIFKKQPNSKLRKILKKELSLANENSVSSDFVNLLLNFLPSFIPYSLLERYTQTVNKNEKRNTTKIKYLLSANGFSNDNWNIICAENVKKGAKLINFQHGGGYGIQLFDGSEKHEINISDHYITMGWGSNKNKFKALPSPVVNKIDNKRKNNKILIISNDYPRYFYRLFSQPVGGYVNLYRKWLNQFLDELDNIALENSVLRLYPIDYSGGRLKSLRNDFNKLSFDDYSKSFENQLAECRVAVSDTNQTTYLQSLAMNKPTIVFWNPKSTEIRPEAKNYLLELKKVGILHDTPKSAATMLNNNYQNIEEWWNSKDVQIARKNFVDKYAIVNEDWEKIWSNYIVDL